MNIDKDTAVTLLLKITAANGTVLEAGREPMVYLHGGYGNTLPKIEAALEGQAKGFALNLALDAPDAFGLRDETLVRSIAKTQFPPGVKVGGHIEVRDESGAQQAYMVTKIKGPVVLLDGNHPFAGMNLRFAIKVLDVRAATAEEMAHGHVHGEHGHQH